MALQGSQTARNLLAAFAGEAQARNRYNYFSSKARKEGFIQIADIFAETADQEKEHAKRLFKFMDGGEVAIQAAYPFGVIGSTAENLAASAAGEHHEWAEMYPNFAEVAHQEGFGNIAAVFTSIAVAEKHHEKRYLALRDNVLNDTVFRKSEPVVWRCRNCGYLHEGTEAPESCPACAHLQGHFEVLAQNW